MYNMEKAEQLASNSEGPHIQLDFAEDLSALREDQLQTHLKMLRNSVKNWQTLKDNDEFKVSK